MRKPKKKVCVFCKDKASANLIDYKDTTLLPSDVSPRQWTVIAAWEDGEYVVANPERGEELARDGAAALHLDRSLRKESHR
ncbi:30S ribosomal protein S18 [Kutzneria sp. 744]|nr:30S ribosomal protein S18 [Kutzneria sp. 744]